VARQRSAKPFTAVRIRSEPLFSGQDGKPSILSAFLFAEVLVQTVYGGDDLIEVSGSKKGSIVFQTLRKKGTDYLALIKYVSIMVVLIELRN
jgi:hypothetical protein